MVPIPYLKSPNQTRFPLIFGKPFPLSTLRRHNRGRSPLPPPATANPTEEETPDQQRPIPPIATQPKMVQPQEPHFFQPLLPGFQTHLTIPIVFFSKHIQGKTNGNTWTLTSDAMDQTWQVIQEERRLTRGWKEFAEAHDLRIGDIVIFKLKGSMVFHVTPFGPSCCDIQYTYPNSMEEAHDHQNNTGTGARFSYSWDYCFKAEVTDSNVREDKLVSETSVLLCTYTSLCCSDTYVYVLLLQDLPVGATGCNALNKECKKAKLVNIEGKAWNVSMRFNESGGFYYIKGWRKFCAENKCHIGDSFVFNVVGDGNTLPLMCVCSPSKECLKSAGDIASSSRVN
ncbi:B3 domain-containing protein REM7-like isoform X1 [Brassica rapa]|uniref:B3 domain-containing protein REM7-like isoform X1 n=1 Tax=Brassica campestris TaxID=3711 RepID=UPI00142DBCE1|nr:B3 domain-containing protein REM7-like isoform X1 [Brassica rapa]